jgi:hypothetical protein
MALVRQFNFVGSIHDIRKFFGFLLRSVVLILTVIVIHLACFWVHLTVLPYQTPPDVGMTMSILRGLVNLQNPNWAAGKRPHGCCGAFSA